MLQESNFHDIQSLSGIGYTLLDLIAQGGMAEVYRALQHSLGREVAVKVMKEGDASLAQRFMHEARLVATLNHRNVVTIYDVGQLPDGRPYLSMELLTGGDLRERARLGLAPVEIKRIVREVADGLSVVHARGIVHRDIKPANILFRADGCAVLCDFGIAKSLDIDTGLTHTGIVVGSPAYSSPEQTTAKPLDARSDLYSLGVVLVELLLGRNPYKAEDYASTVVNQLQMPPPVLPSVDAAWQPIVNKLLAKQADQRFASAVQLIAAIDALDTRSAAVSEDLTETRHRQRLDLSAITGSMQRVKNHWHAISLPTWHLDSHRWDLASIRWPAWAVLGEKIVKGARSLQIDAGSFFRAFFFVLAFFALGFGGWFGYQEYLEYRQIQEWLVLGEDRMQQNKLSTPVDDNALFYFRKVLVLDPDNLAAQQGLDKLVTRFFELAVAARDKKEWEKALDLVERGLAVDGGDEGLEQLKKEIIAAQAAAGTPAAGTSSSTRSSSRPRRVNGFQQFLHNLFGR